jgi:Arc/MetJ-type ribon-helix-helix transcriptional regulator
MAIGMATRKVTITLAEDQIASILKLVERGRAESVSGFVKHAVAVSLSDVAGWGAMLAQALKETGGPLTSKERAWADSILQPAAKTKRKRKAA